MMEEFIIPIELFTKFNEVIYYDEPHKYYYGNTELISVTTLIGQYLNEFNDEYWSLYKANEFGLEQSEIYNAWGFINKKGTFKGSLIHDYSENLFHHKVFPYKKNEIINEFGFDPITSEYDKTKNHIHNFYNDTKNKLIPIKTEMILYDLESLIGGMCDILFYNVKAKEFQIWDYKTNKELSIESDKFFEGALSGLQQTDLNIYSLQLGIYKYIIEKNTNIKLGKSYLVWMSHNNENYKVIETKNLYYYVDVIVNNRISDVYNKKNGIL